MATILAWCASHFFLQGSVAKALTAVTPPKFEEESEDEDSAESAIRLAANAAAGVVGSRTSSNSNSKSEKLSLINFLSSSFFYSNIS